jgi:hypothetical protein
MKKHKNLKLGTKIKINDRAIAQAASRRHPTVAARVLAQAGHVGFMLNKVALGSVRVLLFPLPIIIPPTIPHSSSLIRGWYNMPVSGRSTKWTVTPHPTEYKKYLHKLHKHKHKIQKKGSILYVFFTPIIA